ncbi:MAG: hypothetical protein H6780_02265 [Candidatus Nomurabacteria bacterium]|nr:MAG: hypothetical protein H6780_02265 [Candidatus Nomurabacteria bacterium]
MKKDSLQFEEFKAPSGRATPFVTINSTGRFYLSTATASIYEIDDKKYPAVKFYYDKLQKVVAIKPLTEKEEGSLALKTPKYGGAFVNGASFANKYGLMNEGVVSSNYIGKYIVEKTKLEGIGNVLLFDLSNKHK